MRPPSSSDTPLPDELVPADDAVISRALRRSLLGLAIAIVAGGIVFWQVHSDVKPSPAREQTYLPAANPAAAMIQPPVVLFTDITQSAGIHFVHHSGGTGEKLLPETMGGGVAFLDYDNDRKPDLLFINSAARAGVLDASASTRPATLSSTISLYHNDGNGHFSDVTAGSGLDVAIYGMGVAVGDYDNDGRVDVLITGVGGCRLFHNDGGGHFHDVTAHAGVGGSPDDWSTSAAFFDYDNDGRLDLFVCNYVQWSRQIDLAANYTLTGIGRAFGPPTGFAGAFCHLYHNDGNGHFSDVSAAAGIQIRNKDTGLPLGKSLGVIPIDLDGDGHLDLVVANDTVRNFVFHNNRNGTFSEIAIPTGVAFDANGAARGGMGIDAGWFRNDNRLGIAIGNFANEMLGFYVSHSAAKTPLRMSDDAISQGLGGASRLALKFGVVFFDYDLDGWPDLLCANGHIERDIARVHPGEKYAQPAQLYWNAGALGRFVQVTSGRSGTDMFQPIVGRGCAVADMDGDGDLDIVLTQIDGPPLLLRNDQHTRHHFLRLKLVGSQCNRDAIGAVVTVLCDGRAQRQQVMPTHGYLSQSELPLTFGLGTSSKPQSIEIAWPGGAKQTLNDATVDGLTVIQQSVNPSSTLGASLDGGAKVITAVKAFSTAGPLLQQTGRTHSSDEK